MADKISLYNGMVLDYDPDNGCFSKVVKFRNRDSIFAIKVDKDDEETIDFLKDAFEDLNTSHNIWMKQIKETITNKLVELTGAAPEMPFEDYAFLLSTVMGKLDADQDYKISPAFIQYTFAVLDGSDECRSYVMNIYGTMDEGFHDCDVVQEERVIKISGSVNLAVMENDLYRMYMTDAVFGGRKVTVVIDPEKVDGAVVAGEYYEEMYADSRRYVCEADDMLRAYIDETYCADNMYKEDLKAGPLERDRMVEKIFNMYYLNFIEVGCDGTVAFRFRSEEIAPSVYLDVIGKVGEGFSSVSEFDTGDDI